MNSMKRQKDMTLKDELPRFIGTQHATGEEWRNNSKNKAQLWISGGGSKVRGCKEQYCIGTWNVRPMNQGKLEVVKRDGKSEH